MQLYAFLEPCVCVELRNVSTGLEGSVTVEGHGVNGGGFGPLVAKLRSAEEKLERALQQVCVCVSPCVQ